MTEEPKPIDVINHFIKIKGFDNLVVKEKGDRKDIDFIIKLGFFKIKKELITEFLADLKEIRGFFNIIKNHKSYNGIIEKWEKKKEYLFK